ncbi:DUF1415 domain-containing protein [Photobacterium angustum]|uniref:DUF1415 domain-containing protein n=1 Tax=Photobacterium angustum TaxID=661 RepID=A0A855SFM8_PHOAN|nr:DUF1415 domain-containing protein [Photobacterium angustum]KJF83442.1 hypothetical protein UB36_02515 [Photobacterium damselae subsp. damselae]KJG15363.1 hypothetical protein UA33_19995 [Photobacterium angustum]KJG20442.1 hypothetical protein UA39_19805 [Photobacterium angustum]KJG27235.1 hypothetical protein UA69_20210 [Photobacterium angustum]KJG27398.1 hypothetical protein UA36_20200 [Photobacterium angustum]
MKSTIAENAQALNDIEQTVQQWLNDVVIGLNLCPFAAKPQRNKQIKIHVSSDKTENDLLESIYLQLKELDETPPQELETTLVVAPYLLEDFEDYNQFLDLVEGLVVQLGKSGIYQIASFHPDYCFYGTEPEDAENLTNRSPYPIFHLIREESMEKVLKHYPDPEAIPERNIDCVENLTPEQIKQLFPYLKL